MNRKSINFLKNISFTFMANGLSMLVSMLVILIVPKLIGVEEYGYWQLYLFYLAYIGFLHFGWSDGIYLRYGGEEYNNLDKRLFQSQLYMLMIIQVIIAIILILIAWNFIEDDNKVFIMWMISLSTIITNVRSVPLFVLQATNRIKEHANVMMIGQFFYFSFIVLFLLIGFDSFKVLILAELIGRTISLFYAVICCKDIVFRPISDFYFSFREAIENVNVGIKLMFAYIASLLVIGIVRFGIERSWDITTFGKVSLTLNISNLFIVFINALGIVLFPILRKAKKESLSNIYILMRDILMMILLGLLVAYYPIKLILLAWIPEYAIGIMYMAMLFPMILFEGKMSLLINTYLKTMRKEKEMLKVNIITLLISIIITVITTVLFNNLELTVVSIVIILAFRSVLAELYLSKILKISISKDILLELMMATVFIFLSWFMDSWFVFWIYLMIYVAYLLMKKNIIINSLKNLKEIAK
ncbi:hypothetical protein [Lederbergia citrea]|uniref:hypothetical protein n=1 Tax=Lederbergia citrea TaxID=2833581 RepID=UPI001BCA2730|nr:hypothetical protein [Lederbergia citrea]MBS4204802.1 hypothetical protein [Lederbergia citrea]